MFTRDIDGRIVNLDRAWYIEKRNAVIRGENGFEGGYKVVLEGGDYENTLMRGTEEQCDIYMKTLAAFMGAMR